MSSDHRPDGDAHRHFGVYPAIVTDIVDRQSRGRVEVKFPWLGKDRGGQDVRAWATLCTPYADKDQGLQILPAVDTQVVVAFEAGDLRRPYIIGSCWNGKETLPVAPEAANNKRTWKSRTGSVIEFDDTAGAAKVTVAMQSGHKLELDDAAQQVTLTHENGSTITFTASGQIQIQANATIEVTASSLNVHAPTAVFDGMISCTTMIASSGVVSPSYTQGAGNIW
jgi:uncharacterized protein involved in type VI secretion and phage assembly